MRTLVPLLGLAALTALGCDVGLSDKQFDRADAATSGAGGGGASTTGTGGAGGQGGDAAGGGGAAPCTLSDEMDDAATLTACWINAADVEGGEDPVTLREVDETGYLVTRPQTGAGFWQGQRGPFIYKEITGDFAVVAYINAHHVANENFAPTEDYNLGGLVLRSPPSASETWLKYEIGQVDAVAGTGTLAGSTVTGVSEHLLPYKMEGLFRGKLGLCRADDEVHYFFFPAAEGGFSAEDLQYTAGPGTAAAAFPATIQAGITVSGYSAATPDVEAAFDYVRFVVEPMAGVPGCAAALTALAP